MAGRLDVAKLDIFRINSFYILALVPRDQGELLKLFYIPINVDYDH